MKLSVILVVQLMLMMVATAADSASTFLLVTEDWAPPLSALSTPTTTTTPTSCGLACFDASTSHCLAFLWMPLPRAGEGENEAANRTVAGIARKEEGRCVLLQCLPHPSSLTPHPGAKLYLLRGRAPPHYSPDAAAASYVMACSWAYRVYSKRKLSYSDAEARCARDGATLIIIKDASQERTVMGAVNSKNGYWIGLTDRQQEGEWRWADGSVAGYESWDRGQPNNYKRHGSDQDCAMLYRGAWNDNQCSSHLRFLCQVTFIHL